MTYSYTFTALRGRQAKREYYVVMCPLRLIPKIFLFDENELRAEIRAQRVLNRTRVPEIAAYLSENFADYVLSSITASIDGAVEFRSNKGPSGEELDAGSLVVPMDARILINDGQHRRAAIEEALKARPELGDETISVVFFIDAGLRRSQQMFADLNRHAIRPTFSLGVLYDHRDPLSQLSREVAEKVPVFRDMVEKEKSTISNRSTKMFTLSGIYQASKALLRKGKDDEVAPHEINLAVEFWTAVSECIPDWKLAKERKISPAALREDTVHAHSVALQAIALAGADLISHYKSDWKTRLSRLKSVDWSRSASDVWEGRALISGRVSKAQISVKLTAGYLKQVLGLPVHKDEFGQRVASNSQKQKQKSNAEKKAAGKTVEV